jgi:twitching motility protein PilI
MSQRNASFTKLLEYEKRALTFVPGKDESSKRRGEWAGVVFGIGETRLTCNIDRVHEFLPPPPVTRVPGTKPWILGLANVRGDLVTIVDLSFYLSGERSAITTHSRLLAASLRGRPVGLLVDEVFGQRSFKSDDATKARVAKDSPLHAYINKQFQSGKETWQLFDLDTLFGTPEFLNGAAA